MAVGAMIPDWAFQKELKRMDKKLDVEWNVKLQRWVVTRMTDSPGMTMQYKVRVMTIQNDNGTYRPLDARTPRLLRQYDAYTRGADTIADEIMGEQNKLEESKEAAEKNDTEDLIKEEILPRAEMDAHDLGGVNLPKEDVAAMMGEH